MCSIYIQIIKEATCEAQSQERNFWRGSRVKFNCGGEYGAAVGLRTPMSRILATDSKSRRRGPYKGCVGQYACRSTACTLSSSCHTPCLILPAPSLMSSSATLLRSLARSLSSSLFDSSTVPSPRRRGTFPALLNQACATGSSATVRYSTKKRYVSTASESSGPQLTPAQHSVTDGLDKWTSRYGHVVRLRGLAWVCCSACRRPLE